MGEQKKELTRDEKETLICKFWDDFKEPNDTVEMPVLSNLTMASIDAMIIYYNYLLQEQNKEEDNTSV